jgi:glutamate-1-semialdehyde 2,1-aminomutase
MREGWTKLAESYNLKINISGLPSLSTYSFESENAIKYKTFIAQEMLKKGYLASTSFYASIAHNEDNLNSYFEALNDVYAIIQACELGNKKIEKLLKGPICHSGFKRLN